MRKTMRILAVLFLLAGCGTQKESIQQQEESPVQETEEPVAAQVQQEETEMILKINGESMDVTWEDNASVGALRELAENGLQIQTHMYGGWEQVGSIGQRLPSDDVQTTAQPGDIMLYSSDQIVLFYGNNSWAYTRLGKINLDSDELEKRLSADTVQIEINME